MLNIKDAGFLYDITQAGGFKDVSFSLKRGEVMCILGPNGCGKTTLLKCLCGIFKLDKGSITLKGRDIVNMGRSDVARVVGYVPQMHEPTFPFTVLDVVLVGRAPHLNFTESPKKKDIEIARTAMEALGISHLEHKPYTQLSGGERQLVVFARVMAQQPELLLLDEPTSHLDFGNQIRILHLVEVLSAHGLPIIMTTHFPDHAFLLSGKVAIMKKGEFLELGMPDKVITDTNLENVYGIKVKVLDLDGASHHKICLPLNSDSTGISNTNILLDKLYKTDTRNN